MRHYKKFALKFAYLAASFIKFTRQAYPRRELSLAHAATGFKFKYYIDIIA